MKLAIDNISRWGDTDVFPRPLDNRVIAEESTRFEALLRDLVKDVATELQARPPATIKASIPVGYSGFRWATQIDPLWNAYLLSAVLDLAPQIESARVGPDVVFSHRHDQAHPNSRLFQEGAYTRFLESSEKLANEHSHVVVTDIADFYGRIYHHPLENALLGLPKQGGAAKRITKLLSSLSGGRSYGLPVGGPASRILAELLLNRVDRSLMSAGVKFLRFADDYRLFADSEDQAHGRLATLSDLLLDREGLALQKAKTRVLTSNEYRATLGTSPTHGAVLSGAELKARQLLKFSLRFDPYSLDPEGDFDQLAAAVDELDLIDLFSIELSKSRVDPQFTRKLLKALQFAKADVKSSVSESLCLNLPLLAPVFPQVLAAIKGLWADISEQAKASIVDAIVVLRDSDSYLLRPGVSRAYAVRVLAGDIGDRSETALVSMFDDKNSDAGVRRDVILALANRQSLWWLSGVMQGFDDLQSPAERRALLAATAIMTEEADHFLRRRRASFTPLEDLTADWAAGCISADPGWRPPI